MKIIIASIIVITLLCSACGSSQSHCDAYGNKSASVTVNKDTV